MCVCTRAWKKLCSIFSYRGVEVVEAGRRLDSKPQERVSPEQVAEAVADATATAETTAAKEVGQAAATLAPLEAERGEVRREAHASEGHHICVPPTIGAALAAVTLAVATKARSSHAGGAVAVPRAGRHHGELGRQRGPEAPAPAQRHRGAKGAHKRGGPAAGPEEGAPEGRRPRHLPAPGATVAATQGPKEHHLPRAHPHRHQGPRRPLRGSGPDGGKGPVGDAAEKASREGDSGIEAPGESVTSSATRSHAVWQHAHAACTAPFELFPLDLAAPPRSRVATGR